MSNDEIKDIWQKIDFDKPGGFELTEEKIKDMLKGRTSDIFSKISKNIKIGFWILGVYIVFMALSFYLAYFRADSIINEMSGKYIMASLDVIIDGFIILTFIYFVFQYNKIDQSAISHSNLKSTISEVIKILSTYKRLFYYGFTMVTIGMMFGFILGIQKGFEIAARENGQSKAGDLPEFVRYSIAVVIGLIIIGGILFIIHFVFKKLYGKYLGQLQECQNELIEAE